MSQQMIPMNPMNMKINLNDFQRFSVMCSCLATFTIHHIPKHGMYGKIDAVFDIVSRFWSSRLDSQWDAPIYGILKQL